MAKEVTSRFVLKGDNQLDKAFSKAGKQLASLAKQATLFGTAFAGLATRQILRATEAQEKAVAQLNASLHSTGRFTEENSRALQEQAAALQNLTTYGDEAIIMAQSQLLTFTQLGGEVFPRATAAVLDLSAKMGTDLRSSVIQIGKALNDPIKGVSALAKAGIQFTEQQKEMIRTLVESGDMLGAQKIILQELETQFGGSAAAARNTLGGAIDGLKNAFGDLLEGDSKSEGMRGAVAAINELARTLNDPSVKEGFANLTESVISFVGKMAQVPATIGFLKDELRELFGSVDREDFTRREDEIAGLEDQLEAARRRAQGWFQAENGMWAARARNLEIDIALKKEQLELDRLASQILQPIEVTAERRLDFGAPPPAPRLAVVDKEEEQRVKQLSEALAGLHQQVREFGLDDADKALLQLTDLGAGEEQLTQARQLLDELRILREEEVATKEAVAAKLDLEREYASLVESLMTPTEQHVAEIERIAELFEAGIIPSVEEYAEAINRTTAKFDGLKEKTTELDEFGKQAARNLQTHFADFLFDPWEDGLDGMLKGFAETLRRMAAEAAAAAIFKKLFGDEGGAGGILSGIFGGGGDTGGFAAFIGSIFGKARGGPVFAGHPYLVGEEGPELVVPRLSGMVVPNDQLGGMGGQVINNTFNLPPAYSRNTTVQLAQEAQRRQQIAMARNR